MTSDDRAKIDPETLVPLAVAHVLVSRSRRSVYQWAADGDLPTVDTADGKLVKVADVRRVEAAKRPGRPRKPRA